MPYDPERITYFAETDFRNKHAPFGIKAKDRTKHVYTIGKTGMGKSTMLENMAVQDIRNDEGFAFIDPHGSTAEKLLEFVPERRMKDVLYFAPFDMDHPISFNVMEDVGADKRHLVANGLMSAFKKIWVDAWSARMEYILNNTILALLEYPGSTLISINRMFADKGYREEVVENITDSAVKAFWKEEFAGYTDRFAAEATPAIQNKVGQFVSNPLIRNIIGQPESSFDLREMMDEGKIVIVNLSKGRMGEDNANLLGSMLITKIYLAAMSRADTTPAQMDELPNFYLYVDEFQSFANESFANILSEARKYKLNLTIAHQYIEQMSDEVRAAVFGNVGTMIAFRVGAYDAEVLEKEFAPEFTAEDLVNLGFAQVYLKLMIDGVGSAPFSATTIPPIPHPKESYVKEIIDASRNTFAQRRDEVEEAIRAWHETSFGSGKGGGGKGRGGGGKKGGRQGPEEKEKTLREAISLAMLEEDSGKDEAALSGKDKKSPSGGNIKKLERAMSGKKDKGDGRDSEGFMSLEELKRRAQGGRGEGEKKQEEDRAERKREDRGSSEAPKAEEKPRREDRPPASLPTPPRQEGEEATTDEMEQLRRKKESVASSSGAQEKKEEKEESKLSGLKGVMSGIIGGEEKRKESSSGEADRQGGGQEAESREKERESQAGQEKGSQVSSEELKKLFNTDEE